MCDPERKHCTCIQGYASSNGNCLKLRIGGPCRRDEECATAVPESECVSSNGTCACRSGFYVDKSTRICTKRRLSETCMTGADCYNAVNNSRCRTKACVCKQGYREDRNRTNCIKRRLNDTCQHSVDCSKAVRNSICVSSACVCRSHYEPLSEDGKECVRAPNKLQQQCKFNEQCQRLDPASTCNPSSEKCVCPGTHFVSNNATVCIRLPSKVGEACKIDDHDNCAERIRHTNCNPRNYTCICNDGHFPLSDNSSCHPVPTKIGDWCESTVINCHDYIDHTVCAKNITRNTTSCQCQHGYSQSSLKSCKERPRIPRYQPVSPDPAPDCLEGECQAWTNSTCRQQVDGEEARHTGEDQPKLTCACKHQTARSYGSSECVVAQTYQLRLLISEVAKEYDYHPYEYNATKRKSLIDRVTLSGLRPLFENSSLSDRFVSSEVKSITDVDGAHSRSRHHRASRSIDGTESRSPGGVLLLVLVHFTADYLNPVKTQTIYEAIEAQLSWSDCEIGESRLRVPGPYNESVIVRDFDECRAGETDCSPVANCINTLGSYMCVCKPDYIDMAYKLHHTTMGRQCKTSKTMTECVGDDCESNNTIVIVVLVLFLLTIMVFITYEIIQRKKHFTARALYARFGTTKIRKLKKASMRRIKERKRRMKEESKKRREEHRTKKEEMKKAGVTKKAEETEEKKRKAEEKKQRRLDRAEAKKGKKTKKRGRKNGEDAVENEGPQDVENAPFVDEPRTCIDMPMSVLDVDQPSPPTSSQAEEQDGPRGATAAANTLCDNTYPVASPNVSDVVEAWRFEESEESPV